MLLMICSQKHTYKAHMYIQYCSNQLEHEAEGANNRSI